MAHGLHRIPGLDGIAASAINFRQAVSRDVGDVQRQFLPLATNNVEPAGIAEATAAAGGAVNVYDAGHTVKVTAAASLGAGADIGVASTNGNYGPIAGASGTAKYRVGVSETAAAAGEIFSLYVNPKQLGALA